MNNISETLFQSIDTIVLQHLNSISYDKTEICKVISQDPNNKCKYWVSNGAVNYEAYSTDEKISYHKDEQIFVTVPQGKYEMRKFIAGRYIDNSIKEEELIYTNPYEDFIINNSIGFKSDDDGIILSIETNGEKTITNSINENIEFKYKNEKLFDYIGIDFAFSTDMSTYMGEYALILSLYGENNKLLSKVTDNLIISSKNLYGNPYKLNNLLHFQHLFAWPKHITNITQVKSIGLQLAQNGQFGEDGKVINLTNATVSFGYDVSSIVRDKVELYLENLEGKSDLYQNIENGLSYTPNEIATARKSYINWHYLNSKTNKKYLFNNYNYQSTYNGDKILEKQIYSYTIYLLHYIDGLGENLTLPDDYAWNWEIVKTWGQDTNVFTYNITPVTSYSTDQYKILIRYQTKDFEDSEIGKINEYENSLDNYKKLQERLKDSNLGEKEKEEIKQEIKDIQEKKKLAEECYSYVESNGLIFKANGVTAVPGAANSSLDSLKLKLDDGDTGVYNIYGVEGSAVNDSMCRQPRNIHFEFLDATPYTEEWVDKVEWEFPISNTMIDYEIPEEADKSQLTFIKEGGQYATFSLKRSYKPGAMNNRIWCRVYMKSGEIRTGSLTLQFGEAISSGSNYAFNIDFVGHNACLYAVENQTITVQASFTKSNGEVMTPPEIVWSWKWPDNDDNTKCNGIQIITNDNNQYVTLKYTNTTGLTLESQNYAILQATATYNLDNQIKTDLISELPIPLANATAFEKNNKKYTMAYISGATRVVYDSNGNNSTYSTDHYNLQAWEIENEKDIKTLVQYSNKDRLVSWTIINGDKNNPYSLVPHPEEKDKQGNIITPIEYSLQPLKYIPKTIPKVWVIASLDDALLGKIVLWIQPLLITQNRWSYNVFNEWNGKLEENDDYTLIPMIGAGKKDDNNTFTGIMMGDLSKVQGEVSHTGLYGFNKGSRRFSFDDQGNAYIGNGTDYIDFNSGDGRLAIKSKTFDLQSDSLIINNKQAKIGAWTIEKNKLYYYPGDITSDNTGSVDGNGTSTPTVGGGSGFLGGSNYSTNPYFYAGYSHLANRKASGKNSPYPSAGGVNWVSSGIVKCQSTQAGNFESAGGVTLGISETNPNGLLKFTPGDKGGTLSVKGHIEADTGNIGNWAFTQSGLYVDYIMNNIKYRTGIQAYIDPKNTEVGPTSAAFYAGYKRNIEGVPANSTFCVQQNGHMICRSAEIKGDVSIQGKLDVGSSIDSLKIYDEENFWTYIGYPEIQSTSNLHHMGSYIRWSKKGGITICGSEGYISSNTQVPIIRMGNGVNKGYLDGQWLLSSTNSTLTVEYSSSIIVKSGSIRIESGGLLYDANGAIIVVSDVNKKHEISTLSSQYSTLFDNLRPVTYKYNDGTSDRLHTGFIAQEVQEALDKANIDSKDFAGLVIFDRDTENETWTLRYSEFIALNTAEIQKLKTRVNSLEQEIKEIKEKYEI